MKIYLFCPDTGLYQGEDFVDDGSMKKERQGLPAGATMLAPPACPPGNVPVFLVADNRWDIRDASFFAETVDGKMVSSPLAATIY